VIQSVHKLVIITIIITIITLVITVIVAVTRFYRHHYRLGQAEVRARFDEHKDERDLVKAKKLLEEAEKEFEEIRHPQPIICMICFENVYRHIMFACFTVQLPWRLCCGCAQ